MTAHPHGAEIQKRRSARLRAVLVLPAGLALVCGLYAALLLLRVLPTPGFAGRLADVHGMLLVYGFVATLVAAERALALRRRAGFAAPALFGVGGLLLVSPAPLAVGKWALLGGAAALLIVYVPLWRRQRDDAVLVQALGAVLALGAALLWLGGVAVPTLLPWLAGFIVLTIGGERLELARIAMGPGAGSVLVYLSAGLAGSVLAVLLWPWIGSVLFGLALLGLVGWLAAHDVARRTIHASGLPRFMACCLLVGYFWLAVAGAIWLLTGPALDGPRYDAVVHAVFLGFTLSMIMAHVPVIAPAVLRRPLPYHPALYVAAGLLHLGLAVRLWLGDALGVRMAWQAGGVGNVIAVLLFVGLAAGLTSGLGGARGQRDGSGRSADQPGARR